MILYFRVMTLYYIGPSIVSIVSSLVNRLKNVNDKKQMHDANGTSDKTETKHMLTFTISGMDETEGYKSVIVFSFEVLTDAVGWFACKGFALTGNTGPPETKWQNIRCSTNKYWLIML